MPAAPPIGTRHGCRQASGAARPAGCRRARGGFSLVEVALAIAILGTVLLGMLALLSNGVNAQGEARRDTTAMLLAGQVVEALRGFEVGRDDAIAAKGGTLLDEFLPFSFATFPEEGMNFVLGFDTEGNRRGSKLAEDYQDGTLQDGVAYLVQIKGRPVETDPGLTLITVRVEFPADLPLDRRRIKQFELMMRPGAAEAAASTKGGPA